MSFEEDEKIFKHSWLYSCNTHSMLCVLLFACVITHRIALTSNALCPITQHAVRYTHIACRVMSIQYYTQIIGNLQYFQFYYHIWNSTVSSDNIQYCDHTVLLSNYWRFQRFSAIIITQHIHKFKFKISKESTIIILKFCAFDLE